MATTTPNFGWPVPTSTDLVKDGATAMEALGDAIDTSMVDLKGGTTGQVLSKASNTDMDFSWVAQDDSNAIQNTIVDAKGDLIAASAADTPARLAVGNNGETLVADSSTATGLRYTGGTVQSNPVLNSAAQIWQRGTSIAFNASVGYFADRWYGYCVPAGTFSRQATNDTTNLPFIQYCMRIQRNSGNTNTGLIQISQSFETINSIAYAGKTVTLSFYARKGANFSESLSSINVGGQSGTGTDQNIQSGYTGSSSFINQVATLTTTWQRFTYTGTVSSSANEIGFYFGFTPTGTAGANDYFELTGVQIDIGSVALPFRTYAGTIQGELAACQRYFQVWGGNVQDFVGSTYSTTTGRLYRSLPVTMRIAPTATFPSAPYTNYINELGTANRTPTTLATSITGTTAVAFDASGMTGATAFRPIDWNTTAQIQYSSEL